MFRRLALSSAAPYGVVCELRCAHSTLPSSAQLLRAWQHGSSGRSASCGLVPQKQRVRCESRQRPPRRENQRSLRQVQVHSGARRRRRADRRACTQQRSAPKTWRIGAPYVLFPDAARSAAAQTGAGHHGPGGSRVELEPGAVTARLGRGKQILWTNRGRFHTKAKGPTPVLAQRRTDRGRFSMGHALSRVFPSPGSATPLVPATTGVLDSPALPLTPLLAHFAQVGGHVRTGCRRCGCRGFIRHAACGRGRHGPRPCRRATTRNGSLHQAGLPSPHKSSVGAVLAPAGARSCRCS